MDEATRRAVIILGNMTRQGPPRPGTLYDKLQEYLESRGYAVDRDEGLPYTQPADGYDVWIGHSRGADRLRFAPEGVTAIPMGSNKDGAINAPLDVVDREPDEYDSLPDEVRQAHMDWHPDFEALLDERLGITKEARMRPKTREFDDIPTMRQRIYDNVIASVQKRFENLSNDRFQIRIANLAYDEKAKLGYDRQKEALLRRRSLTRPLKGTWEMVDRATGEVVDKKEAIIAHVPHLTERGTFIHNGSEYTVANQMRLRPGVYTRKKDNGQYEAHFNIMPGSGRAFRVHMDPESGIFKMNVGQANIPLYPVLRNLGVKDSQLEKSWGRDLLAANRAKDDDVSFGKLYKRMFPNGAATNAGQRIEEVRGEFDRMRLDPDVVGRSIGSYLAPPPPIP